MRDSSLNNDLLINNISLSKIIIVLTTLIYNIRLIIRDKFKE